MTQKAHETISKTDVVLVYIENNPTFFARIEDISPDIKKGWWRVRLLILQIPLMVTTWILDDDQIRGADFTMGGTPIRIEKVVAPRVALPNEPETVEPKPQEPNITPKKQARIVSLRPTGSNSRS
ncbi:MAG: hypothetical protein ONB31_10385 [candidate division KSB1 bacterium]|nr:hypothetical protein [candidate division KSB1 bacterium]MDZ7335159.1 hypothetical protein [candidate division KSB1 bacterium]MDZ7356842.1 hypothetical protein [candidate division KSB1 bacterium]MDZ7401319.1 hypothetical protein [candidate division KSB1 bacterium]